MLALGPLTNLAAAIRLDSGFAGKLGGLVVALREPQRRVERAEAARGAGRPRVVRQIRRHVHLGVDNVLRAPVPVAFQPESEEIEMNSETVVRIRKGSTRAVA